jgi:hypothetical protein
MTEFINLDERRFVWIDGVAASPLDNSDMVRFQILNKIEQN